MFAPEKTAPEKTISLVIKSKNKTVYFGLNLKKLSFAPEKNKMITGQLNIKNRSYCFYNDLINILNFEASNLKLEKKNSLGLDISFIGYVDKNPDWNVNTVNPLYSIINRFYGSVLQKNSNKYLIIDKHDDVLKKYDQVFTGIKYHINKIDGSEVVYDKDYMKINFLSDDDIPLNKMIYFPTVTVIIRCVFKQDGVYYPQVYLDDCLYQV